MAWSASEPNTPAGQHADFGPFSRLLSTRRSSRRGRPPGCIMRGGMRESGDAAAKIPRSSQWKEHLDECCCRPLLDLLLRDWLFSFTHVQNGAVQTTAPQSACTLIVVLESQRGANPRARSILSLSCRSILALSCRSILSLSCRSRAPSVRGRLLLCVSSNPHFSVPCQHLPPSFTLLSAPDLSLTSPRFHARPRRSPTHLLALT